MPPVKNQLSCSSAHCLHIAHSNPGPDVGSCALSVNRAHHHSARGYILLAHFQGGRLELLDIGMPLRRSALLEKDRRGAAIAKHCIAVNHTCSTRKYHTSWLYYGFSEGGEAKKDAGQRTSTFSMPSNLEFDSLSSLTCLRRRQAASRRTCPTNPRSARSRAAIGL